MWGLGQPHFDRRGSPLLMGEGGLTPPVTVSQPHRVHRDDVRGTTSSYLGIRAYEKGRTMISLYENFTLLHADELALTARAQSGSLLPPIFFGTRGYSVRYLLKYVLQCTITRVSV